MKNDMKKRYLRFLCFILSLIFLVPSSIRAEAVNPRASMYIAVQSGGLVKTTGNNFEIRYSVSTGQLVDELGAFMIQLSKSTDQVTWYRAEVYYSYDYPEMMREDTITHSGYFTFTGQTGYYYKAIITFYASLDGVSERSSLYTNVIYIPQSGNGGRVA